MIVLFSIAISVLLLWMYTLHSSKRAKKLPPLEYHGLPLLGHLPFLIGGDNAREYKKEPDSNIRNIMFLSDTLMNSSLERGQNLSRLELGLITIYLVCDPEDIATVSNACLSKPWLPYTLMKDWLGHSIFTEPEPAIWRPRRKVFNRSFTQHMLDQYLIIFNEHSRLLISVLQQYVGKGPFNQHEHMKLLAVENLLKVALNLTNQDIKMKEEYVNGTTRILQIWCNRVASSWLYPDYVYKWTAMFKEQTKVIQGLHKTLNEIVERKKHELRNIKLTDKETGRRFKPLIAWLLEMEETGEFTRKDVMDQIHTMIAAGFHTTSTSISLILCALGTYPRVQDKLYAELQEIFGDSDRNAEKQDLDKLVYLDAIVKENLRLFPPAPLILRYGETDVQLKNYTIPKGCYYMMALSAANRNSSWGVDREVFRPERWLEPNGVPESTNAFTTFGIGKRGCIGRTFSMYFLKATIAQIVRKYRIKADMRKLQLRMDLIIQLNVGHEISIENREEAKKENHQCSF